MPNRIALFERQYYVHPFYWNRDFIDVLLCDRYCLSECIDTEYIFFKHYLN